ncbi:hypothetical protein WDU94_015512 [Cyamophila willieti]
MDDKRKVFSTFEKDVFKELVMRHPEICTTNTQRGTQGRDQKSKAWTGIMEEYNSMHGISKRTVQQLKKLWQNMKCDRKEVHRVARQNAYATGGGPQTPGNTPGNTDDPIDGILDACIVYPIDGDNPEDISYISVGEEDVDEINADIEWLEVNQEPWQARWNSTRDFRRKSLDESSNQGIHSYMTTYKPLAKPLGYQLILQDFNSSYPGRELTPQIRDRIIAEARKEFD